MSESLTSKKRVLIIDDEKEIRELIHVALEDHFKDSLQIVEASDGLEGSFKIENQTFDCIITDLNMPKRSGMEFIKKIKHSPVNKNTPVLVITGESGDQLTQTYSDIHIIEKPFDQKRLVSLVNTQLRLGKLNQRVNSETLNFLAKSTQNYLSEFISAKELSVEKPVVKKLGQNLNSETTFMTEITTANEKGIVCIGFDKEILKSLKNHTHFEETNEEVLLPSILSGILKRLNHILTAIHKKPPSYKEKFFIQNQDHFKHQVVRESTGITISIKSELGVVFVTALNHKTAA